MGCQSSKKVIDPRFYLLDLIENNRNYDSRITSIVDPSEQTKKELIQIIAESYFGDENHQPERGIQWLYERTDENQARISNTPQQFYYQYRVYASWLVNFTLKYGILYAIKHEDKIAGVACMFPPGSIEDGKFYSISRFVSTFFAIVGDLGKEDKQQYKKNDDRWNAYHGKIQEGFEKHAVMHYWNLHCLAIKPEYQNMGYGKAFTNLFIQLADKDKCPSYLQCTGENMIKYFENFGYQIQEQFQFQEKDKPETLHMVQSAQMVRWPGYNKQQSKLYDYPEL